MTRSLHNARLVMVGGHTRSIGKTALVEDLIRATRELEWTAAKITQYGHGTCSADGHACHCAPLDGCVAMDEEHDPAARTDTSRFLRAGARRAWWLRTRQGSLDEGLPLLCRRLDGVENAIIESNSLLEFIRPAVYLVVLDPSRPDFKCSAARNIHQADGFVLRAPLNGSVWPGVSREILGSKPSFLQPLGTPLPPALRQLIIDRVSGSLR